MKDDTYKSVRVKAPILGPQYKAKREEAGFPLEYVSRFTKLDIEAICRFESGDFCTEDELFACFRFYFTHIPGALTGNRLPEMSIFRHIVFDLDGKIIKGEDVPLELLVGKGDKEA